LKLLFFSKTIKKHQKQGKKQVINNPKPQNEEKHYEKVASF